MKCTIVALFSAGLLALGASAALAAPQSKPGEFDYYVLSMSWSPQFCATKSGQGPKGDLQCRASQAHDFVLHGLWPQYAKGGWPAACSTTRKVPDDIVQRLQPIMPSVTLPQHEWDKHGTCSGKDVGGYFDDAAAAFNAVRIPSVYQLPAVANHTSPDQIRVDFLASNPALSPKSVAVVCDKSGRELMEVRVCLDKALKPVGCGADVLRDQCPNDDDVTVRPVSARRTGK